ncbi:MAG: hypothetical protein IPO63_13185 [Bacteroidetes bacterium]|nr:hypothetical protein [Bacteroidota bacterium]
MGVSSGRIRLVVVITDVLYSIQQTTDGGYILGGYSDSDVSGDKSENCNGDHDYWIVKVDSLGDIQWQNTIGGSLSDNLYSIQQTSDGGYILGGCSKSNISRDKTENCNGFDDYWIVKVDSLGVIQWENTIGGSIIDYLYSIQQTTDGGYILGGYSGSNVSGDKTENCIGGYDYWIVKVDSQGVIQWQKTIGGDLGGMYCTMQFNRPMMGDIFWVEGPIHLFLEIKRKIIWAVWIIGL